MAEVEVNNATTTLDYLNEDCWRAVLQYVPVRDLIRTERASRRWQELVLMYLRGVQIIIEEKFCTSTHNACGLYFTRDIHSFECWAKKLGTSVVATYCYSLESLAVIKKYCPNIKSLKIFDLEVQTEQLRAHNLPDNFKLLQRIYFYSCAISDLDVSLFIANKDLKEVQFECCYELTGLCFNTINCSNLQRFVFHCSTETSKLEYILPVIERFGELKELKLVNIHNEIIELVPLVLDKMPKLEFLTLYTLCTLYWPSSVPLSRLSRLKHLTLSFEMTDWEVAEVIRCCQELQTLELLNCQCLTPGVVAPLFQHASTRLATLKLDYFLACDDDVVALVSSCPQLTYLVVGGAEYLTGWLPASVASERLFNPGPLHPLRLDLSETNLSARDVGRQDWKYLARPYHEMKTNVEKLIVVLKDTELYDTEDDDTENDDTEDDDTEGDDTEDDDTEDDDTEDDDTEDDDTEDDDTEDDDTEDDDTEDDDTEDDDTEDDDTEDDDTEDEDTEDEDTEDDDTEDDDT